MISYHIVISAKAPPTPLHADWFESGEREKDAPDPSQFRVRSESEANGFVERPPAVVQRVFNGFATVVHGNSNSNSKEAPTLLGNDGNRWWW